MITIKCNDLNDTDRLAKIVSELIFKGFLILASGDLGAGKTRFAKGLALNMGVNDTVTSPTFTLLKTYHASNYTIVHIDAYRLQGAFFDELEDYISDENVIFIEWSECLASQELIEDHLSINIKYISKTFS